MNETVPSGHGSNRARYLLSVTWVQCAVAFVFVASRFYCRVKMIRNLWLDDWCILLPMSFTVLASCTISVYTWYGGTRHVLDLQPTQVSKSLEWNLISLVFCIGAISSGKVSVALLIYRLQAPSKWRTWLLGFLSVSSVIVAILIVVLEYAQCMPARKLWIPTLPGSCWNAERVNDWDITGSCYWAFVDLVLALIPVTFLWNLQLPLKKKIMLCALLGLGIFAAVCGAIKASYLRTLTAKSDITWITVSLLVWNVTEANVIIFAACLPTMWPLFQRSIEIVTSYKATAGSRASNSGMWRGGGGSSNQHIKLGSIRGREEGDMHRDANNAREIDRGLGTRDSDSDKAHILPPNQIAGSADV